jgi:hypothetical protein
VYKHRPPALGSGPTANAAIGGDHRVTEKKSHKEVFMPFFWALIGLALVYIAGAYLYLFGFWHVFKQ